MRPATSASTTISPSNMEQTFVVCLIFLCFLFFPNELQFLQDFPNPVVIFIALPSPPFASVMSQMPLPITVIRFFEGRTFASGQKKAAKDEGKPLQREIPSQSLLMKRLAFAVGKIILILEYARSDLQIK